MEWVETTGRTIEEAKEAALDQLGVDDSDAEFEVLEEPKVGLFGRLRSEARVRARVRPTTPRPKEDRRDRQRRRRATTGRSQGPEGRASSSDEAARAEDGADRYDADTLSTTSEEVPAAVASPVTDAVGEGRATATRSRKRRPSGGGRPASERASRPDDRSGDRHRDNYEESGDTGMDVALEDQAQVAKDFLAGLVEAMQLKAAITVSPVADDTVEIALGGEDLGLLIGPKGATLLALQDLTRTVVQRKTGAGNGRLLVDVQGYRQKRKVALERFALQLADEVKRTGNRKVLEPMNSADRKVVHDAIGNIEGVGTLSEGEDPRRYVVIFPAD